MSERIKLHVGLILFDGDTDLKIDELETRHGVVLKIIANGRHRTMSREDLEAKILSGELTFFHPEEQKKKLGYRVDLTGKAKEVYSRRLWYVTSLHRACRPDQSVRSIIDAVIHDVAVLIADKRPPARSTVASWYREWLRHGKNNDVLVPKFRRRGRKKHAFTHEEMDFCEQVIKRDFLKVNPPSKRVIIEEEIIPGIENIRAATGYSGRAKTVSKATCYRVFSSLDCYSVAVAHHGRRHADLQFRATGKGYEATAPLQYLYEDHQMLPIYIPLPGGGVIRPWLYVAIDLYSRVPWAIFLGFRADFASVGAGIQRGILGYGNLLSSLPSVEKAYPVHGLAHKLVADRGAPFVGEAHERMCAELGIDTIICPPGSPNWKGTIESFFGTLKVCFLKGLPGFIPDVENTTEVTLAAQRACIPYQELYASLHKWIFDVYVHRFHRKLRDIPMNKWVEGVTQFPVDLPASPESVRMSCSIHEKRMLQKRGIEIHGTFYQSEELKRLWQKHGAKPFIIDLRVDPVDIGAIYVKVPNEQRFIKVPTDKTEYRGRDLWLHEAIRAEEVEREKALIAGSDAVVQARKIRKHLTAYGRKVVRGNDRAHAVAALKTPRRPKAKAPENPLNLDASTHEEIATLRKTLQGKTKGSSKC